MRKLLLIISLVTMISLNANAQTNGARIGIKAGPAVNWASAGSIAAKGDGIGLGAGFGLVYDYYFSDQFAVSSGVNLNLIRMKYDFTDRRRAEDFLEETNMMVNRRLKAMNIEIPLMIKARMDVFDSFAAFVEAGGGLSFNCKDFGMDDYSFYWVSPQELSFEDCTNQYRMMQLSMVFGLGVEYEINRNLSTFVQLTFDHSFSNAFISSLEKQTGSILRYNIVGLEVGILF